MTEVKKFDKIWEKEFDKDMNGKPLDGFKRVVKITTVDQSDFKEKKEGDYGEELIYKFKIATPDGIQDAELIYQENKKALGKIIIGKDEYIIWKFVNDDGVKNLFKYKDEYWANVEKRKNKNDEIYFKIKFSYKEDNEPEVELEEIPF